MLNGWFQGMGFPPCARLLTHWFPPTQLATRMSIWNTSHCIGGGIILVMGTQLAVINWRLCFIVPAIIAVVCAVYVWWTLPDTPQSVGLPEVEGTHEEGGDIGPKHFWPVLVKYVLSNPYIWLVAIANFFVYVLRYAIIDWGPTLLTQAKHVQLTHAGWMTFAFEIAGLFGALFGGWVTEKYFAGRSIRACVIFMVLAGVSVWLFWKLNTDSKLVNTLLLSAAGFFVYGPQCLVGIAAANLATKQAAASSVGLTGLFGYGSTVLSGWGFGRLVKLHGWDAGFELLIGVAVVGSVVFAFGWRAKAHGYAESTEKV
jgi:OPA family glycerol-3-phosphate transporter-like MFS transporter/OPA family sugar phosphate sensor protein UhpC-like MFS transporter